MPALPRTRILITSFLLLSGLLATLPAADTPPFSADEQILKEARIPTDGPSLLAYLAARTLTPQIRARARSLIRQLAADDYEDREKATAALFDLGPVVLPLLVPATHEDDLEVRRRATRLVESLERRRDPGVMEVVIRVLAVHAPAGSTTALVNYLPSAHGEHEVAAVRAALLRVGLRDGKPDPALLGALKHLEPLCRGVAAEVLVSAGKEYRSAVRTLLADAEPEARLRTALGLASAREREAVPVLIDLVAELPEDRIPLAEELLFRLAADSVPELPSEETSLHRRKRRDAWHDWWMKNGAKVDLALLSGETQLGYTLAVTFHSGGVRVSEFGPDSKARWTINGLDNAVDACVVGGNRVLIAEYGSSRVTERTFDNKIVWEKKTTGNAIICRRLANGNTFIVSSAGLAEVDREGREVSTRGGLSLRTAYKYPDGRIGMVTSSGEYIRLDRTGKSEKQFPTGIQIGNTLGGIDFLADGGLLVGRSDRVVQLDANGKEVWMVKVNRPYGPTRLVNGNTIVACTATREFQEFDRTGRIVRTIKVDGEPWLARRR
jgi:hypothetical protein